jgi:hypothetical protein
MFMVEEDGGWFIYRGGGSAPLLLSSKTHDSVLSGRIS